MKKIVFLLLCLLAQNAFSQVEIYGRYTIGKKIEPDVNIYGTKKISNKLDFTYFALVEEKYAQGRIGLSYSPKKWISLGFDAGIEQNPALYRLGATIWMGKGNNSSLLILEKGDGKKNYWYKWVLASKFSDHVTFGVTAWRFHGCGPMFKYTSKKLNTDFWIVPAFDIESAQQRVMAGISIKL